MHRDELARHLDQLLEVGRFRDYCPNGLQVEGRETVRMIVTGVSASLELLEQAHAAGADAVLVHHGYFWRGEDGRLTGGRKRRVAFLLAHEISLYAYHLPLDAHPALGNNAQLALRLGLHEEARAGEQDLVSVGRLALPCSLEQLTADIGHALKRTPLVIGEGGKRIERAAWCTGGAQGYFEEAVRLGVDAYITGEVSEQHVHYARESGVAFISAGHHATERFGVQALGVHLASELGLAHRYIEIPNPV
ncbi:MAG: Nif3-like dinuclear metal center hexameric protein [Betaproteobacteria bacterium]|nr:Nif3-like dinuclear metal center hexameric protein [Betaproteobacteria bacterium]